MIAATLFITDVVIFLYLYRVRCVSARNLYKNRQLDNVKFVLSDRVLQGQRGRAV